MAIAVLLAASCTRAKAPEITDVNDTLAKFNRTGAYFTKEELETILGKCNSSGDIEKIFGLPLHAHTNSFGTVEWSYIAPPTLDVFDGVAGFSVRSKTNGEILRWDPILSNRTEGDR